MSASQKDNFKRWPDSYAWSLLLVLFDFVVGIVIIHGLAVWMG